MDFAAGQVPGWHSTIFPPYFVAGAIFSGFAMVLTLAIPLRKIYGLEDFITLKHIENAAKLMLVTGMIVAYGYSIEWVMGWYSGSKFEWFMNVNRAIGPYWPFYWSLILCNIAIPQIMWFKAIRRNLVRDVGHHRSSGQHRHVARTVRHRHHQPAPRLHGQQLGHLPPRPSGTGRPTSARSASSSAACSCSSACFPPSACSRCANSSTSRPAPDTTDHR